MNITHSEVTNLESILTVTVEQNDLTPKIEKILKDYKKRADIPGFRKGMAPMIFIKKKYEASVKFEEINKLLSESVSKYLEEQKFDLIGQAIPMPKDELDLDSEQMEFGFKLGFKPELNIDLSKMKVPYYTIKATEQSVNETLENIKKQFSIQEPQEIIEIDSEIQVNIVFDNEDKPKKPLFLKSEMLKDANLVLGKKVDDLIETSTDNFLIDLERTQSIFELENDSIVENFTIEIKEINKTIAPELNEELFKKVYPKEEISTLEELKAKISEESEKYYEESSKAYFYNKATEILIETIDCPLPEDFLIQSIKSSKEEELTLEEATAEFEKSKKGYQYYIIENKILADNEVKLDYPELKEHIKLSIMKQLANYGMNDLSDEQLDGFMEHSLKDKNQMQKYSEELTRTKLIEVLHSKMNIQNQETDIDTFADMIK